MNPKKRYPRPPVGGMRALLSFFEEGLLMKITVWGRVLSALSGVVLLAQGVCLLLVTVGVGPEAWELGTPATFWQGAVQVVVALGLMALGAYDIGYLARRPRAKSFIMQRAEFGDVNISVNALNNMVQKCVGSHQDLTVNDTRIHSGRAGIVVELKVTLLNGVNIPLTINALQKQIKQYITSCSGVDVQQVRVMVETDTSSAAPEPQAAVEELCPVELQEAAPQEVEQKRHESFADCLLRHTEEPDQYVILPEAPEAEIAPEEPPAQEAPAEDEPPKAEEVISDEQ